MSRTTFALAVLVCMFAATTAKLACLDRNGQPTAWFAKIKFPRSIRKAGDKYAYLDPNGGDAFKVVQGANIDGPQEALTRTFALINQHPANVKYQALFNDETPGEEAKSSGAHAKGVIAYDTTSKTGVYVMHSLPGFPRISEEGIINPNVDEDNDKYGQHVYCISLNEQSFTQILAAMPIEKPNLYYKTGPFDQFPKKIAELSKITQFALGNGERQIMFTKSPKFAGLLYEDIIMPNTKASLAVESWGRPYQAPSCLTTGTSVNINKLNFGGKDNWTHGSDHSKWAVTTGNTKIACFCDMNRMTSQAKRGGSCFCSENANIHTALARLVEEVDKCDVIA